MLTNNLLSVAIKLKKSLGALLIVFLPRNSTPHLVVRVRPSGTQKNETLVEAARASEEANELFFLP
jgi:hypothetical protein